jgi:hypothetical protein
MQKSPSHSGKEHCAPWDLDALQLQMQLVEEIFARLGGPIAKELTHNWARHIVRNWQSPFGRGYACKPTVCVDYVEALLSKQLHEMGFGDLEYILRLFAHVARTPRIWY